MSSDWITLIPEKAGTVPDEPRRFAALKCFREIAPDAHEIEVILLEKMTFFDCGSNFISVKCPACSVEIPTNDWQDIMNTDYVDEGFMLAEYSVPCCGNYFTPHMLFYEGPQGFGLFALSARNPNIGKLDSNHKREMEEILGIELRVIYQHI